ncbi:mucin-5AC-like isoform X1 [Clarias magur]|uniref:Mucin-5AC-like isoform X1 n=1 Tax=Clarias magur TaxID=1594786 RepID=A0A8J4X7K2_CLAMG|nr:mucin-5AC-like isoform X1 [Clarias magur]
MVFQKKEACFVITAVLMLTSSAFCLKIMTKGKSVYHGKLLVDNSRTTKKATDKNWHDEYADDTDGYQSDQPRLTGGSQLPELMLRRWSPTVQCDYDSMSLHVQGSRLPSFLVETSEEGLVPFFQMPSYCGFSVRRGRRDVSLVAKYDGCNVAQQENTYVLPMRVSGTAVMMVCPVDRPLTIVSCSPSAMVVNLGISPDAARLKVNGAWEPVYRTSCGFALKDEGDGLALTAPYASNCWQFKGAEMLLSMQHKDGELTLSCPAVQLPSTVPLPSDTHVSPISPLSQVLMGYPFYSYGMPWDFQHNSPEIPPVTQTTPASKVAPASADQPGLYPWLTGIPSNGYSMPWWFQYSSPGTGTTQTTLKTPTTTPTGTTVAPARMDQQFLYPGLPGMYYGYGMPWWFQYNQPEFGKITAPTTRTTTTPTTKTPAITVAPASADQLLLYPWLPEMHPYGYRRPWQYQYSQPGMFPVAHTTTAPTTTTTETTAATAVASASADQPVLYPWFLGRYKPHVPMSSSGVPVSDPNSGIKAQMYQMPWMSYQSLNTKPGAVVGNRSNVLSHSVYSPLLVKAGYGHRR